MARVPEKPKEGMGARVERERQKRGLSQEKLAEILKISRSALKSKELGERPFSLEEANIICDQFNMTLDELVNGVRTKNVSIHKALGLDDRAIDMLREFYLRNKMEGLSLAFSSYDVLSAISRYMTYTPTLKGFYLSELTESNKQFIECRMSQELFISVLGQNLIHMLDNAKSPEHTSTIYYSAAEDFMDFSDDEETKLAEPSDDKEAKPEEPSDDKGVNGSAEKN